MTGIKRARDVELGDAINGEKVTGWYLGANGKIWIEHGRRWSRYHPDDKVIKPKENDPC